MEPLVKIGTATAAQICANFDAPDEAKQLLRDGISVQEFVAALLENKRNVDAIQFMAYALPAREGVWWGCLCMQHALGDHLAPPDRDAAIAAVRWVFEPSEDSRMAAGAPSVAAPPPSIGGTLATAAFQSGGNIAPPNTPPRDAEPFAFAKSVALAVKLASIKVDPAIIPKMQRAYVELALEIAGGRLL